MIENSEVLKGMNDYLAKKGYLPSEAYQIVLAKTTTEYTSIVLGPDPVCVSGGPDKKTCQITIYRNGSKPEVCEININHLPGIRAEYLQTYFSGEKYEYILVEFFDGNTYFFERLIK
jgi:hypothetical protein